LGDSRAKTMSEYLNELNPDDVIGKFEEVSVQSKLDDPSLWCSSFDLVIGTNLNLSQAK